MQRSKLIADPAARVLVAGDLEATVLPHAGMLVASLRHEGDELLGCVDDLDGAAAGGATVAIPLLHPWANRLAGAGYRAAGRDVALDPASPLLSLDANGLPIHGVPWSRLAWRTVEATRGRIVGELAWTRPDLRAVFPFPHRLAMTVTLVADALTVETTLVAGKDGPVPVSFGFHPHFTLPGLSRDEWRLELPRMRRLTLDARGIPTGEETAFEPTAEALGTRELDAGFALPAPGAALAISGGGRRIRVVLVAGYPHAQVYAPRGRPFVALEPMTAPTNALVSGKGLRMVAAGASLRTAFVVRVDRLR